MIRLNTRDLLLAASALAAAVLAPPPAQAAVIESAPVSAVFATALRFDPTSPTNAMVFDGALGTLDSVTLSFAGTVSISGGAFFTDSAPPDAVPTAVSALYLDRSSRLVASAELAPVATSTVLTPAVEGSPVAYPRIRLSGQAVQGFDLVISAADYGRGAVYASLDLGDLARGLLAPTTAPDAVFRGTVTASFDYTPVGGGGGTATPATATAQDVPEPAALAVLSAGLVGLVMARRRVA